MKLVLIPLLFNSATLSLRGVVSPSSIFPQKAISDSDAYPMAICWPPRMVQPTRPSIIALLYVSVWAKPGVYYNSYNPPWVISCWTCVIPSSLNASGGRVRRPNFDITFPRTFLSCDPSNKINRVSGVNSRI